MYTPIFLRVFMTNIGSDILMFNPAFRRTKETSRYKLRLGMSYSPELMFVVEVFRLGMSYSPELRLMVEAFMLGITYSPKPRLMVEVFRLGMSHFTKPRL